MSEQLFAAIQSDNAAEVEKLLKADPNLGTARDKNGVSALVTATYHRRPGIVEIIRRFRQENEQMLDVIEAAVTGDATRLETILKEDPSAAHVFSPDGWTPLHLAAAFASRRGVEMLLKLGAEISARSKNSLNNQPLHATLALNPDPKVAEVLLKCGADVNARQHGGYTPLHEAAASGKIEWIKLLLAHGADKSLKDDSGKTALDLAREKGKTEAAKLLEG